jgi:hypothetical protein
LNDKERVAAALENAQLSGVVTKWQVEKNGELHTRTVSRVYFYSIANTDPLDEVDEGTISLSATNFSFGLPLAV